MPIGNMGLMGIGSAANAFSAAFDAAQKRKEWNDSMALKQQEHAEKLQMQGLMENPDTKEISQIPSDIPNPDYSNREPSGNEIPGLMGPPEPGPPQTISNPKLLPEVRLKRASAQQALEKENAGSDLSQREVQNTTGLLKGANKDFGGFAPGTSAAELERNPYVLEAMKGGYGQMKMTQQQKETQYKDSHQILTEANKETQKYSSQIRDAKGIHDQIDAAAEPGGQESYNALGVLLSRYINGTTRLNVPEINAMGQGEKDILGRLSQIYNEKTKGTLSPDNAQYMHNFVNAQASAAKDAKQAVEDDYGAAFAREKGLDPNEATNKIFGHPYVGSDKRLSGGSASKGKQGLLGPAAQPHPQDQQAIQWAQQNPNNPLSVQILKANGVQ